MLFGCEVGNSVSAGPNIRSTQEMVDSIIINVDSFLQFVYASVLALSAKPGKNFKSFMPNHALITKISDVLFIISLIIFGLQTGKRSIQLLFNLLVSRK